MKLRRSIATATLGVCLTLSVAAPAEAAPVDPNGTRVGSAQDGTRVGAAVDRPKRLAPPALLAPYYQRQLPKIGAKPLVSKAG